MKDMNIKGLTPVVKTVKDVSKKSRAYSTDAVISKKNSTLYRSKTEIKTLRKAIAMAESDINPIFFELIRHYIDIDMDSKVTSAKSVRENNILARKHLFLDSNESDNVKVNELFRGEWYQEFIKLALDGLYFGESLIKIGDIVDDMVEYVELIPRQNVNPKLGIIVEKPYDSTGKSYLDEDVVDWFVMATDSANDNYLGLYSKVGFYQIMLKNTQVNMIDYIERFGSPHIICNSSTTDERELMNLEDYLSNFGKSTYAVIGEHDKITSIDSSSNDGVVFLNCIKECKANISDLILGSETLGSEKSFVGSAEVSERIAESYSLNDIKYIESIVNNQLIPKLVKTMPFLNGYKLKIDTTKEEDKNELLDNVVKLVSAGLEVDPKWIEDKFGIPIIGKMNVVNA